MKQFFLLNSFIFIHFTTYYERIVSLFIHTFCHVILGIGVPTALTFNVTVSPSFTFKGVKRCTNFGETTSSFSTTPKLH